MSIYRYVTLLTNQLRFPCAIIYNAALLSKGKTIWLQTEKCVAVESYGSTDSYLTDVSASCSGHFNVIQEVD